MSDTKATPAATPYYTVRLLDQMTHGDPKAQVSKHTPVGPFENRSEVVGYYRTASAAQRACDSLNQAVSHV